RFQPSHASPVQNDQYPAVRIHFTVRPELERTEGRDGDPVLRVELGSGGVPMTETRPRKVSAAEVESNRRRGGDIRVTLSPKTVGSTSGFGGVLRLAVGEVVTEHYHPYSEEFLHVVTGELTMTMDGEKVTLGEGDSLLVPIGVRHRLVNVGRAEA